MSFVKSLKVYLHIFYYHFLTILMYPYEFFVTLTEPAIEIGFLALFWSMIARAGGNSIDLINIISYFILVYFVSVWALNPGGLNFANYIGSRIKTGKLSEVLVKPLRVLPALLSEQRGYWGVDFVFSILLLFIAVKLSGGATFIQYIWFFIFVCLSFLITFSFCVLIGSLAFFTKEISSIRYSISHLVRILTGAWVPLNFFPDKAHDILNFTPFPSMMFVPINILQNKLPLNTILFDLRVSLLWSAVLLSLAMFIWNYNLRKYEATGL